MIIEMFAADVNIVEKEKLSIQMLRLDRGKDNIDELKVKGPWQVERKETFHK